jgi:hypothetical protein
MNKHSFKVGDEVKISTKFPVLCDVGKVCIITEIKSPQSLFDYSVKEKGGGYWNCPVTEDEIESVIKVGEQLLFNFMLKGD